MASYRLYCLDDDNHITHRHDFDADDDNAAIGFAETQYPQSSFEIWEIGRKVVATSRRKAA